MHDHGLRLLVVAMLCAGCGAGLVDHDEYRNWAWDYLATNGVAADAGSLRRAVSENRNATVRLTAADLLTNLKKRRTASLLRARLAAEGDEQVRAHFASDLLELEGKTAIDLALATLRGLTDLIARMHLARGLAEVGDLSGYQDVLAGLHSKSSLLHSLAAQDLASFVKACGGCAIEPQPLDVALGLLEDPTADGRLSAVMAVEARLGDDPRCVAALEKVASSDEDYLIRDSAAISLRLWRLKKRGGTGGSP